MDEKDWVLLLVPIITNGIFVFLAQFLVKVYFDEKQNKKIKKQEQFEKVCVPLKLVNKLTHRSIQLLASGDIDAVSEFEDCISEIRVHLSELNLISIESKIVGNAYGDEIKTFLIDWDNYYRSIVEDPTIFSHHFQECAEKLSNLFKQSNWLVQELS